MSRYTCGDSQASDAKNSTMSVLVSVSLVVAACLVVVAALVAAWRMLQVRHPRHCSRPSGAITLTTPARRSSLAAAGAHMHAQSHGVANKALAEEVGHDDMVNSTSSPFFDASLPPPGHMIVQQYHGDHGATGTRKCVAMPCVRQLVD